MAATSKPQKARVRKPLTQEKVRDIFDYDPATGILKWKCDSTRKCGSIFKPKHRNTCYLKVCVDYIIYCAHKIIWVYITGIWPDFLIDHEDGDGLNNKWDNLRRATESQNAANSRLYSTNTSGFKGVHRRHQRGGKWQAIIRLNYKAISCGLFSTPEEAHAAYLLKAKELFGEFARAK